MRDKIDPVEVVLLLIITLGFLALLGILSVQGYCVVGDMDSERFQYLCGYGGKT